MARNNRRSTWDAFQSINLISAIAMMVFAISGFVMTGIAGTVIDYLHTYQFLPLGMSFGAIALAFMTSDTRDPRYYHPAESAFVVGTMALMGAHAFMTEVQDFVAQHNPISGAVVIVVMVIASAIVSR